MDFIEKILEIQNSELLVKIAIDNYDNIYDRKKFIEKYDKKNFKKLKIIKGDIFKSYEKRINNINNII